MATSGAAPRGNRRPGSQWDPRARRLRGRSRETYRWPPRWPGSRPPALPTAPRGLWRRARG
eukprot:7046516-Alexandrium_andersonii.AAC.1